MKKCNTCLEIKLLSNFPKNKRQKDGYHYICKSCRKKYNTAHQKIIKEYRENNKEKIKNQIQKWKSDNPERVKELWRKNNAKKTKEKTKLNNQQQKEYIKKWNRKKYHSDTHYKISQILRIRLIDALKNKTKKTKSSLKLLSCTLEECKLYLESKFLPEMSWENHGEIWEIDHIRPCASFNLEDIKQQKECFHYSNLQPLFKTSGIAKSFGYIDQIGNRNKKNKF